MLTPDSCQVNSVAMVDMQSSQNLTQTAQQILAVKLIQPILDKRRPQRVLLLKHSSCEDLQVAVHGTVQLLSLSTNVSSKDAVLHTRLSALPFESDVFDMVVLQHLVEHGGEAVLDEALRVLAPGGDIVISGLNSAGLRFRFANRSHHYPGLRLNRIIYHLKSESIKIEHCLRTGLACMPWPRPRDSWYGLTLPFADRVILHGHHHSNIKNASVLRFKKAHSPTAATAALDGLSSRKAAS